MLNVFCIFLSILIFLSLKNLDLKNISPISFFDNLLRIPDLSNNCWIAFLKFRLYAFYNKFYYILFYSQKNNLFNNERSKFNLINCMNIG